MKKIILLFALSLLGCKHDHEAATKSAKEFARKVPDATGEVECARKDTDSDGYCACTIFRKSAEPLRADCGCEIMCVNCAEGCKLVEGYKVQGR